MSIVVVGTDIYSTAKLRYSWLHTACYFHCGLHGPDF